MKVLSLIILFAFVHILVCRLNNPPTHDYNSSHSSRNAFENPLEAFRVDLAISPPPSLPSILLTTNTNTIDSPSPTLVSVSYGNVHFPSYDDIIALYPDGADVTATAPIKFKPASVDPLFLSTGNGTTVFRVINMRYPVRFAFVRGGLESPEIAGWATGPLSPRHPNLPTQGHLALTGNPGEMAVQWTTRDHCTSKVLYWKKSDNNDNNEPIVLTATHSMTSTYTKEEMCGAPANASGWAFSPGHFHRVVIQGLEDDVEYEYKFKGCGVGEVYSDVFSFVYCCDNWSSRDSDNSIESRHRRLLYDTNEMSSDTTTLSFPYDSTIKKPNKLTFLAIADLGQAELDGSLETSQYMASLATINRLTHHEPSARLLLHTGDISYARGFSTQWDVYWDLMAPLTTRLPYMTAIGNHEHNWPRPDDRFPTHTDSGGECGIAYTRRTGMPVPSEQQPWYAFNLGPVHFIVYSTEHYVHEGNGNAQYEFIKRDLEAVNRTRTPWVVVGGHRPMYVDAVAWSPLERTNEDQAVATYLRQSLEPLFLQYKVDVTLHGHHHSYQRTCPVANGTCAPPGGHGIVHLVMGHAGAGLTPNVHLWRPKIFEKVILRHGYLRVGVDEGEMVIESVSSEDGGVMDVVTLRR